MAAGTETYAPGERLSQRNELELGSGRERICAGCRDLARE